MNIIKKRTAEVRFCRITKGNESEELCVIPYEIVTIRVSAFKADGFASAEYPVEVEKDMVCVSGRYFVVGRSTCDMKAYWNSVTLPPDLHPVPKPREWEVLVSTCKDTGKQYIWDTNCVGSGMIEKEVIRVREVTSKAKKP